MPAFVIFPIRFILLVRKSRSQTGPWRRQQTDQFQPKTNQTSGNLDADPARGCLSPFVRPRK
jgi:hypothetical protein